MRLTPATIIRLYPGAWRERYGDEMRAMLDSGPTRRGDAIDLARGALDAWLHPPRPSWIPPMSALGGGGLWTAAAIAIVAQPVPPDWPGYLIDVVPPIGVAALCLFVATLGCALRSNGRSGRSLAVAVTLATIGYLAWIVALAATVGGLADGPTLAAAQALAMIGTIAVGMVLIDTGDEVVGLLLVTGSVAMLIPWTVPWLLFGAVWTTLGVLLAIQRRDGLRERSGST